MLAGEAKWTRSVDGRRLAAGLQEKIRALGPHLPTEDHLDADGTGPQDGDGRRATERPGPIRLAICAREEIRNPPTGALTVTAADIFSPP